MCCSLDYLRSLKCCFVRNMIKSSRENYLNIRSNVSKNYLETLKCNKQFNVLKQNENLHRIWYQQPLDLTPKNFFVSSQNKKLKSKASKKNVSSTSRHIIGNILEFPEIDSTKNLDNKDEHDDAFKGKIRLMTANAARREAIQFLLHEKSPFKMPIINFKDDIHRPLEDITIYGKNEFDTTYEKDPLDITFKNHMLKKTLPELSRPNENVIKRNYTRESRIPKLIFPDYERSLLLQKKPYQKGRDTKEIFYDKVQRNLSWSKEKFEFLQRPDIYDNKTDDWLQVTGSMKKHQCLDVRLNKEKTCSSSCYE